MRGAGILMGISAMPSIYGVGDFGIEAYKFVDIMHEAKLKIWQILPLNPLGYGNSPYQPYSSIAMDEIYISLELLIKDGLIKAVPHFHEFDTKVNYDEVRAFKQTYLKEAFSNFKSNKEYVSFKKQSWVNDFAHFMALKKRNNSTCWNKWNCEDIKWIIKRLKTDDEELNTEVEYQCFIQFIAQKQWVALKTYANKADISIMGDMPIYVGIDSLDVWANKECFLLDENNEPTFIAGVPPDYFAATGQRWGNPIYDWDYLEKNNFAFWIERLKQNQALYDIIRIDHFRAFDTYWKIPVTCPTATLGCWVEAPGYALFDKIYEALPDIKIVAEDLGDLRPEVLKLRDHYNLPGMKIVQFTFDIKEKNNNFKDVENMIIYTGTHDNETIVGWYESQNRYCRGLVRKFFKKHGYHYPNVANNFIAYTFDSIADLAIIPMQDILGLNNEARLNYPGTVGSPNWEWRTTKMDEMIIRINDLKEMLIKSKRATL